jgi:hypothetical protein
MHPSGIRHLLCLNDHNIFNPDELQCHKVFFCLRLGQGSLAAITSIARPSEQILTAWLPSGSHVREHRQMIWNGMVFRLRHRPGRPGLLNTHPDQCSIAFIECGIGISKTDGNPALISSLCRSVHVPVNVLTTLSSRDRHGRRPRY